MKRFLGDFAIGLAVLVWLFALSPAHARAPGYVQAQQAFDGAMSVGERLKLQVLMIAAGYSNGMPNENFSPRLFEAIKRFQAEQNFIADGVVTPPQRQRLQEIANPLLNLWGFRKVTHPARQVSIWAPLGLGLTVTRNQSGLNYKDPQRRLSVDFTTVANLAIEANFRGLLGELDRSGAKIHYKVLKDGWLVISAGTPNGVDWYLRYHQDGPNVIGFTLQWNNANGNINAERIAVLMSASLWSEMTGAALVEPPPVLAVSATARPPEPASPPTSPPSGNNGNVSSGTGFFVSSDGDFVTNAHVVENCSKTLVKTDDGLVVEARVVAKDAINDLALLKIAKAMTKPASLRTNIRLGEPVAVFGFPHSDILSTSGNFTLGNVTATNGMGDDSRYLQVSAPVQAGNSGGPLLDQKGNLVGIVSMKLNALKVAIKDGDLPQNVNFAIKSAMLAAFLDSNNLKYQSEPPSPKVLEPADLADIAKGISGFVVCR